MKEMVRAIFSPDLSVEAVEVLIDRLLARLSRSRLRPFIRLGRTIRKHRPGILAARRLKLSNACLSYCTSIEDDDLRDERPNDQRVFGRG